MRTISLPVARPIPNPMRNDYALYLKDHDGDWVAVQTKRDGVEIRPELVTSRTMTDEELGALVRRMLPADNFCRCAAEAQEPF